MYKVIIDSKAEQDLIDIFLYVTETLKSPDTASQLYTQIKHHISSLDSMPHRCLPVMEEPYNRLGVRKLFIENYVAFFLIEESTKEVHVFRILYNRRQWYDLI